MSGMDRTAAVTVNDLLDDGRYCNAEIHRRRICTNCV